MDSEETALLQEPFVPPKLIQGKDEMNLAEFPLSAIAERTDPNQKTLVFEDRIWDESRGEMITRQLTITASDQYGLPTALDDEVILGLVQLSKLRDFAKRKVPFTRYQLIRILGWRDESKSYERLEKSLNRWVGVTLYYQNAWWDKENKSWVDEKFHIIDNVTLYDREKARKRSDGQKVLPISTFTWNDVLFRSFTVGNLKSLDFDFYKTLDSAVAKRLYRFLDKRFFHRHRWEFNLKEVSWEHIGLARSYDTANLKRKMLPGVRELEARGFLHPMSDAERFRKVTSGDWRVVFEKARPRQTLKTRTTDEGKGTLIRALIERGVTNSTAEQVVLRYAAERIQHQLEVFDWLLTQRDPKVSRNPAGYLVSSIKSEYVAPKGFESKDDKAQREAKAEQRRIRAEESKRADARREHAQQRARDAAIAGFWDTLSEAEREGVESEAIAEASALERNLIGRGGSLGTATKKSVLDAYALRVLQQAA